MTHTYTDFIKAEKIEYVKSHFFRVMVNGDIPSKKELTAYLKKTHPEEMKKFRIETIYVDNDWLTPWNVGNPSFEGGCFCLMIIFLKPIK